MVSVCRLPVLDSVFHQLDAVYSGVMRHQRTWVYWQWRLSCPWSLISAKSQCPQPAGLIAIQSNDRSPSRYLKDSFWPTTATSLAPITSYPRPSSPTGIKPFARVSTTCSIPQAPSPQSGAGPNPECEKRVLQVRHKTQPAPHGHAHPSAVTPTS